MSATISANGKSYPLEENATVESFLNGLELKKKWVVVELNGEPLPREQFSCTQLKNNDRLEIVTPIAGG